MSQDDVMAEELMRYYNKVVELQEKDVPFIQFCFTSDDPLVEILLECLRLRVTDLGQLNNIKTPEKEFDERDAERSPSLLENAPTFILKLISEEKKLGKDGKSIQASEDPMPKIPFVKKSIKRKLFESDPESEPDVDVGREESFDVNVDAYYLEDIYSFDHAQRITPEDIKEFFEAERTQENQGQLKSPQKEPIINNLDERSPSLMNGMTQNSQASTLESDEMPNGNDEPLKTADENAPPKKKFTFKKRKRPDVTDPQSPPTKYTRWI